MIDKIRNIRKALAGSSGFTLVEVLMAVSVSSVAVGVIGSGIFQITLVQRDWADDTLASKDLDNAASWFAGDALNAEDVLDAPGGNPIAEDCDDPPNNPATAVSLTWSDTSGNPIEATYSTANGELTREDGENIRTSVISTRVQSLGFFLCGSLLTLNLGVQGEGTTTETSTMRTYLRKLNR